MEAHTFKKGDRFELLTEVSFYSSRGDSSPSIPSGATGHIESIIEPGHFGCKAAKVSFDHYSCCPIVMVEKLCITCNEND